MKYMKNMKYMKQIEAKAQAVRLVEPKISRPNLFLNIENPNCNGKRIRFSKALSQALGITNSAAVLPLYEEGLLLVAKALPFDAACLVTLKDDRGAKIAYDPVLLRWLQTELDIFADWPLSWSFHDITIDKLTDATTVALVRIFYWVKEEDDGTLVKR